MPMLASCSLLCSLLVTVLATRHREHHTHLEALKARLLADLGMEKLPDMREANTSRQQLATMTREYLRRANTHHPTECSDDSVTFQPGVPLGPASLHSALLLFPDSSPRVNSSLWRWTPHPTLVAPCAGRGRCCRARLLLRHTSSRGRRAAVPPCGRSSCCRKSFKVNFHELGWEWVLQPTEFEAFFCSGRCKWKGAEFSSTHALLQAIGSAKGRGHGPCCAPTKLRPLDLLHYNDKSPPELVVTRQKGMIVRQCACT